MLFTGILFALLFWANQDRETVHTIEVELPGQYAEEGLHALAFLQPESTHQVISQSKTDSFVYAKWIGFSQIFQATPARENHKKVFCYQDINRCRTVSLLLFPYHIFW